MISPGNRAPGMTHVPLEAVHPRLRGDARGRTAAAAAFLFTLVSPAAGVAAARHRRRARAGLCRPPAGFSFLLRRIALELPHGLAARVEELDRHLLGRVLQVVVDRRRRADTDRCVGTGVNTCSDAVVDRLRLQLPQHVDAVEHVERAAVRADHQVVVLDDDAVDRRDRQLEAAATATTRRRRTTRRCRSRCRGTAGPCAFGVFANHAREVVGRDAGDDLRPASGRSRRSCRCRARDRRADSGCRRDRPSPASCGDASIMLMRVNVRQIRRRDLRPVLAAVARHVDHAVVRARPDHVAVVRRRREREDRRVGFDAGLIERDRAAGRPERLGIGARQVGADALPALAFVGRLPEQVLRRDVERVRIVSARTRSGTSTGSAPSCPCRSGPSDCPARR